MTTRPAAERGLPARAIGFVLFILLFLRALVLANLQLARVILLEKRENLRPGFISYPSLGLSKLEVLILSHCISLTPGTTTVEISHDFSQLILHSLDARDLEVTVAGIRKDLEAPLLRWTR